MSCQCCREAGWHRHRHLTGCIFRQGPVWRPFYGGGNTGGKVEFLFGIDYGRVHVVLVVFIVYPVIYPVSFLVGHAAVQDGFHPFDPAFFLLDIQLPFGYGPVKPGQNGLRSGIFPSVSAASGYGCGECRHQNCLFSYSHPAKISNFFDKPPLPAVLRQGREMLGA